MQKVSIFRFKQITSQLSIQKIVVFFLFVRKLRTTRHSMSKKILRLLENRKANVIG